MLFAKESLPEGPWPMLFVVERSFRELESLRVEELDLTEGLGQLTISGCIECYRQMILQRVLETTRAIALLWSRGLELGAVLSARSLYESVACFHDFLQRVTQADLAKDYTSIAAIVDQFVFSTKDKERLKQPGSFKPVHVLEQIRAYEKSVQPGSESFYDRLSDSCHPNGHAMLRQYGSVDGKRFKRHSDGAMRVETFTAIYNAVYQLCWLYTAMTDLDQLLDRIRFLPETT